MDFPKDQRGRGATASRKGRINVEHGAARRPTIPKNHGTRNRLFQTDDTELSRRTGTGGRTFRTPIRQPEKNIDDCCTFIINQVRQSGCNGFADEEIYSMALHYYDEEDIDIGKPVSCKVVVNHTVELTEEEKPRHGGTPYGRPRAKPTPSWRKPSPNPRKSKITN